MVHGRQRGRHQEFRPGEGLVWVDDESGDVLGDATQNAFSWGGIKLAAGLSRGIGRAVAGSAKRVGAKAFAREWKWARLALPLQARLAAEQGLWDLGGDYRRLVSGFEPIGDE